jgi:uncharacterized membrane protein
VSAVEEQLAWEAEQRPRATAAALAAGLLTFAGALLFSILGRNGPGEEDGFVSITEALGAGLQGGEVQEQSLFARQVDYYGDNAIPYLLTTLLTVGGAICLGLTLAFLYRALIGRAPDVGRLPIIMTVIGTVSFAVGRLVRDGALFVGATGFDAAGSTADEARDVVGSGAVIGGYFFEGIGEFALGVGIALVAFHAMRAGLLTRFLGILGVIVGVLTIPLFAQLDQLEAIRSLWLVFVGWLVVGGRTRLGLLPAWQTGRAEPWPSQQQVREQREAVKRGVRPGPSPVAAADDAEPAGEGAVSASRQQPKRKRKRRR